MATKAKKSVAKSKPEAKAKLKAPQKEQGKVAFGSESHAVRTVKWAADLGLVPKSVYDDAVRAGKKAELIEGLKRVQDACEAQSYIEQAKRVGEVILRLTRTGE